MILLGRESDLRVCRPPGSNPEPTDSRSQVLAVSGQVPFSPVTRPGAAPDLPSAPVIRGRFLLIGLLVRAGSPARGWGWTVHELPGPLAAGADAEVDEGQIEAGVSGQRA
jgi:hypothetical protein